MTLTSNQSRKDWDTYFIDLALAASSRATCPKRHVGAVVIDKDNNVISTGYNGSAPGEPHCDDIGCLEIDGRCKRTIHAEDNAIRRTSWWKRRGARIYITDFPCFDCALLVVNSGITEVIYYKGLNRSVKDTLALFEKEGIVIRQHYPG